jgi:uncharacterized protein YbjT (DUF2867 family)
MQNFHTFWLQGIVTQGKILLPVGTAKGSFIDVRDIAAAAVLLTSDTLANRDFDLTGPEALDHDQVAAILSRESGRRITFQDIPPAAMVDGLIGAGLPRPNAEFLVMLLGFFKAGYAERTTDAVAQITPAVRRAASSDTHATIGRPGRPDRELESAAAVHQVRRSFS